MYAAAGTRAARDRPASGSDGLSRVHLAMIDAVLAGEGVDRVAALAAGELGGAVAIVLPAVDVAVVEPDLGDARSAELSHYVNERLSGRPAKLPGGVVAEVAVDSGDERLGCVMLVKGEPAPLANEILRLTGLVALTAVTLEQGAPTTQRRARAGLLDDMRRAPARPAGEIIARAKRLGCDLSGGASALSVRPAPGDSERVQALIAQEFPGALTAARGDRIEALLPAHSDQFGAALDDAGTRLAKRLSRRAPTGLTPREHDVAALPRALRAAELTMTLAEREGIALDNLLEGSWQLLVRVATGDPGQLQALVDSTVGPALARDRTSRAALLDTLRAYIEHGANMNATAGAIFAHRHTIAYRLEQLTELTGYDPRVSRGQAQLALGLQALAVRDAAAQLDDSIRHRPARR